MDALQKMAAFILSYPGWEAGVTLTFDSAENAPGALGLFPEGVEEISLRQDIMGNRESRQRMAFSLYGVADDVDGGASLVARFQSWVHDQSAAGLAPTFGDAPQKEQLRAEKGSLSRRESTGGLYCVKLTAEFTKHYEVNENGEN